MPPGYYCVGASGASNLKRCSVAPGFLEWPVPWDGVTNYEVNEQVSWFIEDAANASESS